MMTILALGDQFHALLLVITGQVAFAHNVQLVTPVQIPPSKILFLAQEALTLLWREWVLVLHALVASCAQVGQLSLPAQLDNTVLLTQHLALTAPKATTVLLPLLIQCNAQQVSVLQQALNFANQPRTGATQR